MTDLDIMVRAAILLGAHRIVGEVHRDNKKGRPAYYLALMGPPAIEWMMKLYPLMGERRKAKIMECLARWKEREQWTGRRQQRPKRGPRLTSPRSVWTNPNSMNMVG